MRSNRRAGLAAILATATVLAAGCTASPQPTPSTSTAVVELLVATDVGTGLRFRPDEVSAPARTRVRMTFRNVSAQSHNLTFQAPVSGATRTIVEAGASDTIDLVTPGPGRYSFVCTIHLGMSGTLSVE